MRLFFKDILVLFENRQDRLLENWENVQYGPQDVVTLIKYTHCYHLDDESIDQFIPFVSIIIYNNFQKEKKIDLCTCHLTLYHI